MTTDENVLVIDNDLRTIKIPKTARILGVESDDSVRRIYFSMPSTYYDIDLSEFVIRINYLNANNEGDVYAVTDSKVEGNRIVFSWLVGRTATAYEGYVKFIVCLKRLEEDIVVQEFNTTVASMRVLEGIETSEAIIQKNPDVLEEILKRQDKLEQTGGVTDEQVENAVDKYLTDNQVIRTDNSLGFTPDGKLTVNRADVVEEDNTLPITSAAVHTTVGNIEILLQTI